jgi:hypothetical protein
MLVLGAAAIYLGACALVGWMAIELSTTCIRNPHDD